MDPGDDRCDADGRPAPAGYLHPDRLIVQAIFETMLDPMVVLDTDLRVRSANRAFYRTLQADPAEIEGRPVQEVGDDRPDLAALWAVVGEAVRRNAGSGDFEAESDLPGLGGRILRIRAIRADGRGDRPALILLTIEDRGGRERDGLALQALQAEVAERERADREIRCLTARQDRRLRRIGALRRIDMAITSGSDLGFTLNTVLDQVIEQLGVDAASVLDCKPGDRMLETIASKGFRTEAMRQARVSPDRGIARRVVADRRPLHIADLALTDEPSLRASAIAEEGFVSYHAVPLLAKGQVVGVLEVFHRAGLEPDSESLEFLEAVAGQTAIAIDNAGMFESLRQSNAGLVLAFDATIEGWSRVLDLRDHEDEGHSRRVAEMTVQLALAMGIEGAELIHLRRGALLHDIGKMGIPDAMLRKSGPLTDQEWAVMRRHPSYAAEMLSPIEFLRPALEVPYCHHEWWDGSGYPRGLIGAQIPLSARIFAAVNVWDSLSHDRPYRVAWPQGKVREHIRSLAGTHLDPHVVTAFLGLLAGDLPGAPDLVGRPDEAIGAPEHNGTWTHRPASDDEDLRPLILPEPWPAQRPLSILIADDHAPTMNALKRALTAMGHDVLTASRGDEAWQTLQRGAVQVVISDWMMPGMDGPELCHRIRCLEGRPYTYVILVAGKSGIEDRLAALAAGADDFLAKPLESRELAARLEIAGRILAMQDELLERSACAERMQRELMRQNERLAELVATDPLTGLSNRRHFLEALETNASLAARRGESLSVVMLDVDRFKRYNDAYGHRAGDEVLRRVAEILHEEMRGHDVVARYGGEEFVVLLPGTGAVAAQALAERLRAAIAGNDWPLRPVTASLGIATTSSAVWDSSALIDEADQALYRSKRTGRNRVTHFAEFRQLPANALPVNS